MSREEKRTHREWIRDEERLRREERKEERRETRRSTEDKREVDTQKWDEDAPKRDEEVDASKEDCVLGDASGTKRDAEDD